MDAGKKTINDIFNGNRILEIPFFQRAYVWEDKQWERLLNDMETVSAKNKPYFLGSVILKQKPTGTVASVGDIRTVIDGQQRLTTLNIFFKVLCLKSNQNQTFERIFKLLNNDIALSHSHNDIKAFNQVLNLTQLDDLNGDDNITNAYKYFKANLNPDKLSLNNILSNILFVGIDLGENEDEQQIFDTINSLGVKLTTAELLKNYFFGRNDFDKYEKFWKPTFENDKDTKDFWDNEVTTGKVKREFIDLFFFSYLQIKIQEDRLNVNTEDKIEYSKVDVLFESYKEFIEKYLNGNKQLILEEIVDYAKLFKENFDTSIVEKELTHLPGIERINAIIFGLDTSTLIPYVLFVLKNVENEEERNGIFDFLETYIMRRMVTHAVTKNYNQLFTDRFINKRFLSKQMLLDFFVNQEDKVNYLPTNEELKEGFYNSSLINKQSAGILYLIESRIRNKEFHSTQLLGMEKYSLEHIMPKKWENNWGKLHSEEEIIKRNRKLLTLGNLTIITQKLNSSISDANWKTKLNGKNEKRGLKYYASGLDTLNDYLNKEIWDETTIQERADFLFDKAIDVWKIS